VWDPAKARANARRHGVDFADAAIALEDEHALTVEDRDHDEVRFRTLAMAPTMEVLLVVFTMTRGDTVRIISARRASRAERADYDTGLGHG
jgi:hypothetical protein